MIVYILKAYLYSRDNHAHEHIGDNSVCHSELHNLSYLLPRDTYFHAHIADNLNDRVLRHSRWYILGKTVVMQLLQQRQSSHLRLP